jgi:ketosteroid isomerase-like protein
MVMKTLISLLFICLSVKGYAMDKDGLTNKIIGLEKSALERWNNGDPSGFLELSATDVVYFDPGLERRMDGIDNLSKYYEAIRGKIHVDRYEMLNPNVQAVENMAVLTFNLISYIGDAPHRWNCTEVYRLESDGNWKIIQTHWSFTKPNLK